MVYVCVCISECVCVCKSSFIRCVHHSIDCVCVCFGTCFGTFCPELSSFSSPSARPGQNRKLHSASTFVPKSESPVSSLFSLPSSLQSFLLLPSFACSDSPARSSVFRSFSSRSSTVSFSILSTAFSLSLTFFFTRSARV